LKSSIFVCIADTILMLVMFVWLLFRGCSFRAAARHVWYDRFEVEEAQPDDTLEIVDVMLSVLFPALFPSEREEAEAEAGSTGNSPRPSGMHPGSAIDHQWRLGMAAFILGGLPQAIKVFGMGNIPLTQASVAMLLASFLISELFRLVAGTAGTVDPSAQPKIAAVKEAMYMFQPLGFFVCLVCSNALYAVSWGVILGKASLKVDIMLVAPTLVAFVLTCAVSIVNHSTSKHVSTFSTRHLRLPRTLVRQCQRLLAALCSTVCTLAALDEAAVGRHLSPVSLFAGFWAVSLAMLACFLPSESLPDVHLLSSEHPAVFVWWYLLRGSLRMVTLLFQTIVGLQIVYRLLFMGSLSRYPKMVFGLKGSSREFWTFVFIFGNFFGYWAMYAYQFDSRGTYKPAWADVLG
jgi:hypothetical protein